MDDQLKQRLDNLDRHLWAENAGRLDIVMETYEPQPEVMVNDSRFEGVDQIRNFHERLGFGGDGSFSDLSVSERHRFVTSGVVIIEQMLSGRQTGKWLGIPASGRNFSIPVCTVYIFGPGNKLLRENVYFDSSLIKKQLLSGSDPD